MHVCVCVYVCVCVCVRTTVCVGIDFPLHYCMLAAGSSLRLAPQHLDSTFVTVTH